MIKRLTVITDSRESLQWNLSVVKRAAEFGADRIIIRGFKDMRSIELIIDQCREHSIDKDTKIGINAYPTDEIMGLEPDFIHMNGANAQRFLECEGNLDIPIGLSIHNIDEMEKLTRIEPEYILLSPVYEPSCKEGVDTLGIHGLEKLSDDIKKLFKGSKIVPPRIIALGGVNTHNYIDVLSCRGVHGIAVMSKAGDFYCEDSFQNC